MRLRRILACQLDLQKSLKHANISDKSTIRKTLNKNGVLWEDPTEDATAVQKKHCCTSEVSERAPGCSTALLAKYSVDKLN